MAATFEQLKAAAKMLQATMASEDEKIRADALSVMYTVGTPVAPPSRVSGQQQSSPRSPPPAESTPRQGNAGRRGQGQPTAAAALASAAASAHAAAAPW